MQRVMKIIAPLCVEPPSSRADIGDDPAVVEITLGNDQDGPPQRSGLGVHSLTQFLQYMRRAGVTDAMDRIQAQGIDMILGDPVQGIIDEIAAYLGAAFTIEVHSLTPRSLVAISEIGTVLCKVVSLRPQMVVDHIQHHGQSFFVTGIDQRLQALRATVRQVRSVEVSPVIAPISLPRKLGYRHEFHSGNAKVIFQIVEIRDDGSKRSAWRKGPRMEFIENQIL